MQGALNGIQVFDLTRVLAGPTCTQILGDLGADVIKVEQPGVGDVTRSWGPPFIEDANGAPTSAYYLSANRNKRSMTLDLSSKEGQEIALSMIAQSDILVENFLTGSLEKYGLGYDQLKEKFPKLIYCSITGFGHTGPYAKHPGYDFQVQGMGGIMSLTGEPDGSPMRVGISFADYTTGLYSAMAILAALQHRNQTGGGQHIDMALLDAQVAGLVFEGQGYLMTHDNPKRQGNAHPNIVPYGVFKAKDRPFIIAMGKDEQFHAFCHHIGKAEWAHDSSFGKNAARVEHRATLIPMINEVLSQKEAHEWTQDLEDLKIPCGPVNQLSDVFENPQVQERQMAQNSQSVPTLASPLRLEKTPVNYAKAPPALGEHTREILQEKLSISESDLQHLHEKKVI